MKSVKRLYESTLLDVEYCHCQDPNCSSVSVFDRQRVKQHQIAALKLRLLRNSSSSKAIYRRQGAYLRGLEVSALKGEDMLNLKL